MEGMVTSMTTQLAASLQDKGWMLATAESCTGGLIAAACTELPGSSNWFDCGFVTYSDEAKVALLGVDEASIRAHGAVSEAVARAMAFGAARRSHARVSVAVTGIAGPAGGSKEKPVGTVWFGYMVDGSLTSETKRFAGDRAAVREATVDHALAGLLLRLGSAPHP
jgi:nicotinamide-nucleotide amidase